MERLAADPRFRTLAEIFEGEAPRGDPPAPDSGLLEAAVALVLRATDPIELLIIKRAEFEGDPWSGHMALPGGRWEPDDPSLAHTAVRETLEETGVDLGAGGLSLGRLGDVKPASPRLPPMRIAPFVFGVPASTDAAVVSRELESVHWVAVDRLRNPETWTTVRIHFSGFSKTFPSYAVGDEHVWGLTHRILTGFLDRWPHP